MSVASVFKSIGDTLKKPAVYWTVIILFAAIVVAVLGYLLIGRWLDAIIIALALAIIAIMVVVLRVFFTMEKEDRLGRGIDDPERRAASVPGAESVDQLLLRAVEDIRGSRLGAGGLDALPWILMLGESGEGKTAAIRHSGLELPAEYANRISGAPTGTCDWWLTNDAIVLDMAGRFLKCDDESTQEEWATLLPMLRKQRPGCALNSLIFTISVDSLLGRSSSELEDIARCLRRRINEATDELGVDLPVYLVVTKIDHVEGFVECVSASPVIRPLQAFGWTNDQRVLANPEEWVVDGFQGVIDRLEKALPELLMREPDRARRRRIHALPDELQQVIRAVGRFAGRAFAETPYDAPPYLRGVYLTSALREGQTVSPKLHRLGQNWARNRVDGTLAPGGFFLKELFSEIIIGDQDLALPVDRFGKQTRRVINIAAGFIVAMLAVWWLASFGSNLMGIRRLSNEAAAIADGSASLAALDGARAAIVEEAEDMRILRRGGLAGPMQTALARAQQTFVWGFGREYEVPAKRRLVAAVKGFDSDAFEALAQLATDVTWLGSRGDRVAAESPDLARYAPISANQTDVEAFRRGYEDFVRWASNSDLQERIDRERDAVADGAARLLELSRLEAWADSSRAYPPARYADIGVPGAADVRTEVSGAYTRRAWEGLVVRLLEAIDSTGSGSSEAKRFQDTYVSRFDERWRAFMMDVPLPAAAQPKAESSPYLDFIEMLDVNTDAALPRREALPRWMEILKEARRTEPLPSEIPKPGAKDEEKPPPPPWKLYSDALAPVAADTEAAMKDGAGALGLATAMADRKGSNFEKALKQVGRIVPAEGDPEAAAKIEAILSMPILNAGSAVAGRAFKELDEAWRAKVVTPSQGRLTTSKLVQLYGEGGAVEELTNGPLKPFYENGKATRVIGDRTMPFGSRFLRWMKNARRLQRVFSGGSMGSDGKILVSLKGVPARVKSERKMKVTQREIVLRCDDGTQRYEYNEGGMSGKLRWSPDCDELYVRVTVVEGRNRRELTPAKEWKGPMALPEFLQSASRSGNDLNWTLRYPEANTTVQMTYRLREGDELLSIRHAPPPASMGD